MSEEHVVDVGYCPCCDDEMNSFDSSIFVDPEGFIDDDCSRPPYWNDADLKKVTFYFCNSCEVLAASCNKCKNYCILSGHMGFAVTGEQYSRAIDGDAVLLPANAKVTDLTKPRFNTSELEQLKLRLQQWEPRGPDNNYPHFWKCVTCKLDFTIGK